MPTHIHEQSPFEALYTLHTKINSGGFGVVWRGTRRDTGERVAIKLFDRTNKSHSNISAMEKDVCAEVTILQALNHPKIIKFYDIFMSDTRIHLVLELVEGGDLFDRIIKRKRYSEENARRTCKAILEAIIYCHDMNVVHRDLKPENILVYGYENDYDIRIADFGLAAMVAKESPNSLKTQCGSLMYMAPEMIRCRYPNQPSYGPKVDMWSLGVITYILLGGDPPFYHPYDLALKSMISQAKVAFPMECWGHLGGLAKKFIRSLLTKYPDERLSARQAIEDPWFRVDIHADAIQRSEQNAFQQLKVFNAKRKLRSAVITVQAVNKLRLSIGNTDYKWIAAT